MPSAVHAVLLGDDPDAQGLVAALLAPRDLARLRTCRAAAETAAPPGVTWAELCGGSFSGLVQHGQVSGLRYLDRHGHLDRYTQDFDRILAGAEYGQLDVILWILAICEVPAGALLDVRDRELLRATIPLVCGTPRAVCSFKCPSKQIEQ
jgi:hypothetical protein